MRRLKEDGGYCILASPSSGERGTGGPQFGFSRTLGGPGALHPVAPSSLEYQSQLYGQCGSQTHLCSSLWEGDEYTGRFHGPANFHFFFGLSKTVGITSTEGINSPAPVPSLGLKRHHKFPSDPLGASDLSHKKNLPKVTALSGASVWEQEM